MYALVALLGHARRARRSCTSSLDRDRRYIAPFAIALARDDLHPQLGLFIGVGTVVALALLLALERARGAPRRSSRDALIGYGAVAAAVPAVAADAALPGAPHRRAVGRAAPTSTTLLAGARRAARRRDRRGLALLLVGGSGLAALARTHEPRATRTVALADRSIARARAARLAGLADLPGVREPLLRRVPRAGAAARRRRPRARAGASGSSASSCSSRCSGSTRAPPSSTTKSNVALGRRRASRPLVTARRPRRLDAPRAAPAAGLLPARRRALRDVDGPGRGPAGHRLARRARPPAGGQAARRRSRPAGRRTLAAGPGARARPADHPHRPLGRAVDVAGAQALGAVGARAWTRDPRLRREAVVPVFGSSRLPRGVRAVVYRRVGALGTVRSG